MRRGVNESRRARDEDSVNVDLVNDFVVGRSGNWDARVDLVVIVRALPNEFTDRDWSEPVQVDDLGVRVGSERTVGLAAVQTFRTRVSICGTATRSVSDPSEEDGGRDVTHRYRSRRRGTRDRVEPHCKGAREDKKE